MTTAYRKGHLTESLAAWMLRFWGYRILSRRFKTPVGEIDIVARRGRVLCFVEVKYRKGEASETITAASRARITRAAALYVARHREYALHDMRFDAVAFSGGFWPRHIKNAWREE